MIILLLVVFWKTDIPTIKVSEATGAALDGVGGEVEVPDDLLSSLNQL